MLAEFWETAWKFALYQPKYVTRPTQIQTMEPQTLLFNEKSHKVTLQKVWIQGKVNNVCEWSTTFLCSSFESNNNTHINTHTHTHTHSCPPLLILLLTNANWEDSIFSLTTGWRLQLPYLISIFYYLEYRQWPSMDWSFFLRYLGCVISIRR